MKRSKALALPNRWNAEVKPRLGDNFARRRVSGRSTALPWRPLLADRDRLISHATGRLEDYEAEDRVRVRSALEVQTT